MTRVNADIDPKKLHRAHLIAEIREITMVPASLRRSLRTKSIQDVLESIPDTFSLGKGHVKFFYNKIGFLQYRFTRIADEMERRSFVPDRTRIEAFDGFDAMWTGHWQATDDDNLIVMERITMRIEQKPHLYKDALNA